MKWRKHWRRRTFAGKITDFYAFFREVSRFYAQIRAVVTRCYAFLRVRLNFNHGWTPMDTDSDEANHGEPRRETETDANWESIEQEGTEKTEPSGA